MRTALWPHGSGEHPQEIEDHLANASERSVVLVAEHPRAAGLAGFAEAGLRDVADGCASSPVAYLEGWYVDPALRRSGVGRALVEAVERWARDLALVELASDSELEKTAGQGAHLALGFQQVGRVVQYRKSL